MNSILHVSPSEQLILEEILRIKNRLAALRKDRNTFYKVEDVVGIYKNLVDQVQLLQKTRETEKNTDDNFSNRVDYVLDDCFQLLSLFYMALGKNFEIPATYVQLVTINQNLHLFSDHGYYTQEDLLPFKERLAEIQEIIKESKFSQSTLYNAEIELVSRKLRQNMKLLEELENSIREVSEELSEIYSQLVYIKNMLIDLAAACNGKLIENSEAIKLAKESQRVLLEIDELRINNNFLDSDGTLSKGQAQVVGVLEQCFDIVHDLLADGEAVSDAMKPLYERLLDVKRQLEKLYITRRWALRETDLWSFQVQLQEIDSLRRNGQFVNELGEPLPTQTQSVLNYLLHKCYSILYKLLCSSEPIAESLVPIHNQLLTLRRCLIEIKKYGGPLTAREMYPYQMKLHSIDSLRVDGKFLDNEGQVPEGQGIIMSLLNECYDILHELNSSEFDE
ncbi:hypothetical protein BB560_002307 [Smittium megazygosporum]|uniref:Uncharacterized protein n=1 Tax=Smittium megazygosporum TaxID=133381 RepID=A0A2T9ZF71_9FUNG|nr:hypothetical protein BB560_002307 [Smittium megazygosporum]